MLGDAPATLLHGDYRLDNLLIGGPDDDYELAVVDWQGCRTGRAMCDVAYFISGSLEPEIRRLHQDHLLKLYLTTLGECGVTGYTFEQCRSDFRLALLERVSFYVVLSATVDLSSDRAVGLANAMRD